MPLLLALLALLLAQISAQGGLLSPLIREGDKEAVEHNLGMGSLPDQVDPSSGETPLMAAVETGAHDIVEVLLMYHGNASAVSPSVGTTPFIAAAEHLDDEMMELFLKYGHSPDIADSSGRTPRKVVLSKDEVISTEQGQHRALELLGMWDKDGAESFEDPPGTWLRLIAEKHGGATYYFNVRTKETTYLPVGSCSWVKTEHVDHPGYPMYINVLTQQTRWTRPAALRWHWVKDSAGPAGGYWHNDAGAVSQWETPGELSAEQAAELKEQWYWHNTVTGETTWEDPLEHRWRQVKDQYGTYWFHPQTHTSTRTPPEELMGWERHWSERHARHYYYRAEDDANQWEPPEPFAWERVRAAETGGKDEL